MVFGENKVYLENESMENLNKNLIITICFELIGIFLISFPLWAISATVINIIAIVFLIKYKPKNYKFSIAGLAFLFIVPISIVFYLMSRIQC
jgi:hypothetical protein